MATYSEEDVELIAAAIGQDSANVAAHRKLFEAAAHWFRLSRGQPQSARRLLKHLGVPTDELGRVRIEDAYDGPGDFNPSGGSM